jgi:HEAT repeat protein
MKMKNQDTPLENLLIELAKEAAPLRAALVNRLSLISAEDLGQVKAAWATIPVERKRLLMSRLSEASESNFEADFTEVALFAIMDDDAEVREKAISSLWFSEEPTLFRRLIQIFETDESEIVRAAAAEALGRFILAAELGDQSESIGREAEDILLHGLMSGEEPLLVQRRALESLGYSSRDELDELILAAADHPDLEMQASALFAMGRSADDRWQRHVMQALDAQEPELQFEAARAAGELMLGKAVVKLTRLTTDISDREIREAAIWSLGEIGGSEAVNALMRLAERERDEDLLLAIEDAINNAQLAAGQFKATILETDVDDELIEFDDSFDDED